MKTLSNKFNQALFFLAIALVSTFFASCKDDKDHCQKCAEERESANEVTSQADSSAVTVDYSNEATSANVSKSSKVKKTTSKTTSTSKEDNESDENVSIINPNDKSNSDSKRTYGSSGTGGGSGTSGSGGDGNGSSGWNSDQKKKQ